MATEHCRKSGQIPAFGDWDYADELPITQYFECARQAGLLRCSCSGECGGSYGGGGGGGGDLYGVGFENSLTRRLYAVPQRKTSGMNKTHPHSKEQIRKQVKDHQPQKHYSKQTTTKPLKHHITIKPVDEDLYKIPPQLLQNSKRKKMLGFFSKCMVPPCAA